MCDIKHVNARVERVPYATLWCKGEDEIEEYDDSLAQPPPVTEQGYIYDVPADPLELPPRTTTSLPIVEYDVVTADPEDFRPLPDNSDENLIPEDLDGGFIVLKYDQTSSLILIMGRCP